MNTSAALLDITEGHDAGRCDASWDAHPTAAETTNRRRFLKAVRCIPVDRPPVWLMRQAGRALPEYRALREKHSFLELVQTPELAAEVTLQPIRRFDFDAAILFSDILVVPEALGQRYHFRDRGGVEMEFPIRSAEDIARLDTSAVVERLNYVARTLPLIKSALSGRTALLGFAGSPWTLANFMMEGGSAKEFSRAKALFYSDPVLFSRLMEKLTTAVTQFLQLQIDAGVDAIQIFDSLGGILSADVYEPASSIWIRWIIESLGGGTPVIVFGKGAYGSRDVLLRTGAQAFSVDWTVPLAEVREHFPENVGVQGNLDPFLLNTTPAVVAIETSRILETMRGHNGHIFNLGHGTPPTARLECIESLVATVRSFK
ncbi:MAG TPA: uroporphyrinogen decarboxylase [Candidatus Angelobacter sp.]|nr:uroporphyrinogen decarboxylase [Candidatus Angelobacter sp.]